MPNLTTKELGILEEQLTHEALCNHKAAAYAESLKDPTLKTLVTTIAQHHKKRYESLFAYLGGQQ